MALFEVWSEGYAVTGGSGQAQLIGEVEAETFAEACQKATDRAKAEGKDYGTFDPERLTLWGCRLFDNEADARRAYG